MAGGRAYHRYFEGYSERRVWDSKKQRFCLETYYSGDYYQAQVSGTERARIKREYLAGYVCAVLVFLFVCTRRTAGAADAVTAAPTLVILLGLLWQLPSLLSYLGTKELLIMRQYRERNNFMSLSMGLACFFVAGAAARLCCMFYYRSFWGAAEWLTVAGHLLDAAVFYRIYKREKGLVYRTVPNEEKIPDDCYDITLRDR